MSRDRRIAQERRRVDFLPTPRASLQIRLTALLLLCIAPDAGDAGASLSAPPDASVNPVASHSLADFPATLQRPLFAQSRRKAAVPPPPPPAAPLQEPPKSPPSPPAVTLIGVIADPRGSQAMLRSQAGADAMRVRVGDDVMGWRVSDIGARRLTLTLGDRDFSIALFSQKPTSQPELRGSNRRAPFAQHDQ